MSTQRVQKITIRKSTILNGRSLDQTIQEQYPGCEILHHTGQWTYPKGGETYEVKIRLPQRKVKR